MQHITKLPTNYQLQTTLELSKSKKAVIGAIGLGIVLFIATGWLLAQFAYAVRPDVLNDLSLREILTITPDGSTSINLPFWLLMDSVIALVLVILIHELTHGVFYWWFSGQFPTFGVTWLGIYVEAPINVYFPRNQYLMIGIAPFLLLTLIGLFLLVLLPVFLVPIILLFITFNAAGSAADLILITYLLACFPDTLLQDCDKGIAIYRLAKV